MIESLGVLEDRILHIVPDDVEEEVKEEFSRFRGEVRRMSRDNEKIGQATLTPREVRILDTTNQHGKNGLTVIQWQAVKAAALKYGVTDWTKKVDGTLTMDENVDLMRTKGTDGGPTMRELEDKIA